MNFKKKLLSIVMLCFSRSVFAQLTDTSDKVGIGVNNPSTKLHIGSSLVPTDTYPPSAHNDYSKFKDYDVLYLQRTSNSSIGPSLFFKGINNMTSYSARLALFSKGGANSDLAFLTSNSTNYNQQEVMRLTHNGNLGIGTTTVDAKLKIYGENLFDAEHTVNNQDLILLKSPDPANGGYFSGITWQIGSRRRASIVATREHEDSDYVGLAFFTKGTDGPGPMYESMRITRNGNLGIGIKKPEAKLHVAGTIKASEIKVEAQTADFVFEPDYKLRPLN